jgi:4-hydroxy-2-oxoheptanedioate aldolase
LPDLRTRIGSGGPLFNAILSLPEPAVGAILGSSGYDFVVIDAEHGPFTLDSVRTCVEAIQATSAAVVVRSASRGDAEIRQLLDLGVDGVQVPMVSSAEQAAAVVHAARYPPLGGRGIGGGRAAGYGLGLSNYLARANASIAVLVMIEDAAGVDAAPAIAATDGIDGIVIGTMDLSASLGFIGQPGHPEVTTAVTEITAAATAAGVAVGIGCRPGEVPELRQRGMTLFTCFIDALGLGLAARGALTEARPNA